MTAPVRITSVSISRHGKTPAPTGDTAALARCSEKWAAHQEAVKGLRWSECPPEMLRDFVIATAMSIRASGGEHASQMTDQMLAITMAPVLPVRLHAALSGSTASLAVEITSTQQKKESSAPGVEFVVDAPKDATEEDIREGLRAEPPSSRLAFDPIASLPSSDMVSLVRSIEQVLGSGGQEPSDMDVLVCSASILMLWARMEAINATIYEGVLSGLTNGNEDVLPGQSVTIRATTTPLDPQVGTEPSDEPRMEARVRFRAH